MSFGGAGHSGDHIFHAKLHNISFVWLSSDLYHTENLFVWGPTKRPDLRTFSSRQDACFVPSIIHTLTHIPLLAFTSFHDPGLNQQPSDEIAGTLTTIKAYRLAAVTMYS